MIVSEQLISQGLECFVAGDFVGAARLWLTARVQLPDDPQLRAYLDHLREISPALVAELEAAATSSVVDPDAIEEAAQSLLETPEVATSGGDPLEDPTAPGDASPATTSPATASLATGTAAPIALGPTDPWTDGVSLNAPMHVASTGPGLDLVKPLSMPPPSSAPPSLASLLARMRKLMSVDNFSGALDVAQTILSEDPNHVDAQRAAAHCRERLESMYLAKLGDLAVRPAVRMPPGEVIWLDLDHRSGFVLAQVDGSSTFEEILELTGMPRLETLRILYDLVQKSVIGLETP